MIIQLSSTCSVLCLIRRRPQKEITHIPFPVTADHRNLTIAVRGYIEPRRSRSRLPAQPLSVGDEIVNLDRPRKLHERVSPRDEFPWGEYDHDVSFLTNSAMSYPSLTSSVVDIRMP